MAIAYDATAGVTDGVGGASSYTWSHTCTGANGLLLVMFYSFKSGDTTDRVTSVTYNGIAMTQLHTRVGSTGGWRVFTYGLVGPATGTNTVAINFNTTMEVGYRSASYTGVSQSGLPDATNGVDGSGVSSLTCSVTSVADNCWAAMFVKTSPTNQVAGADTTRRTGDGFNLGNYDSNAPKTPAGTFTLACSWTSGGSNAYAATMVSFAPAVAAAAAPPFQQQVIFT